VPAEPVGGEKRCSRTVARELCPHFSQRFAQRRNRFLEAVLEQEARAEEAQRLPRELLRCTKIVALDGAPAVYQVCYGMGTADRS
jgi:hypothetical protein